MEFKILFNDNNSVKILDEELQKIGINELLQRLRDSDYDVNHEIEFYTPDNSKISFLARNSYDVSKVILYQIHAIAVYKGDILDFKHNASLDMYFKIFEVYYAMDNFGKSTAFEQSYNLFNEKMNDIINKYWEYVSNFNVNDEFKNIFNAILKVEIQRAIEYRANNFTNIKENFLICKKNLLDQKKEIDDKLEHISLLLTKLEDEYNKGLHLKK